MLYLFRVDQVASDDDIQEFSESLVFVGEVKSLDEVRTAFADAKVSIASEGNDDWFFDDGYVFITEAPMVTGIYGNLRGYTWKQTWVVTGTAPESIQTSDE